MSSDDRPSGLPQRRGKGADPSALPDEFGPLAPLRKTDVPEQQQRPQATPEPPGAVPAEVAQVQAPEAGTDAPEDAAGLPTRARPSRDSTQVPDAFRPIAPDLPNRPPPRSRLASSTPTRSAAVRPVAAPRSQPLPPAVEPLPASRPRTSRGARIALVVVILCVVIGLVGAAVLFWIGGEPRDDEGSAARTEGQVSATDEFEPPFALAADSEYVETVVLEDDSLVVTHWISTVLPMDQLALAIPTSPGLDDQLVDVTELVVAADGVAVDAPSPSGSAEGVGVLPAARQLYVRYQLSGVLQRSTSAAGRALATVTSLDVGVGGSALARTQAFPGAKVLTLACLDGGPRSIPTPCGSFEEGTWSVRSEPDDAPDTVIAQFDLSVTR